MKKTPEVTESVSVPPGLPNVIVKTVLPIVLDKGMNIIKEKAESQSTKSKKKPHRKKKKSKSLFPQSKKRRR